MEEQRAAAEGSTPVHAACAVGKRKGSHMSGGSAQTVWPAAATHCRSGVQPCLPPAPTPQPSPCCSSRCYAHSCSSRHWAKFRQPLASLVRSSRAARIAAVDGLPARFASPSPAAMLLPGAAPKAASCRPAAHSHQRRGRQPSTQRPMQWWRRRVAHAHWQACRQQLRGAASRRRQAASGKRQQQPYVVVVCSASSPVLGGVVLVLVLGGQPQARAVVGLAGPPPLVLHLDARRAGRGKGPEAGSMSHAAAGTGSSRRGGGGNCWWEPPPTPSTSPPAARPQQVVRLRLCRPLSCCWLGDDAGRSSERRRAPPPCCRRSCMAARRPAARLQHRPVHPLAPPCPRQGRWGGRRPCRPSAAAPGSARSLHGSNRGACSAPAGRAGSTQAPPITPPRPAPLTRRGLEHLGDCRGQGGSRCVNCAAPAAPQRPAMRARRPCAPTHEPWCRCTGASNQPV